MTRSTVDAAVDAPDPTGRGTDAEVVVVGGGPVGLTLAVDLARHGVAVRVLEARPDPETRSKACNLWPRTQEVLDALGVLSAMRERALVATGVVVTGYGRHLGELALGGRPSPHPAPLLIEQAEVERILDERLAQLGVRVDRGTRTLSVVERAGAVDVRAVGPGDRPVRLTARYVVACDGAAGATAAQVGLPVRDTLLPGRMIRQVDARLDWARTTDTGRLWFFLTDDGVCGVLPLPQGRHRVFVAGSSEGVPEREPTDDEVQDALRRAAGDPTARLHDVVWRSSGRFGYGVAPAFRSGRVLLAGDAGHHTVPIGGQGMNTGVQDAANLGWKLAAVLRGAPDLLLDSYAVERHAVRSALAEEQAASFRRLFHPGRLQRALLPLIAPLVLRGGRSIDLPGRDFAQLDIAHPTGPLTLPAPGRRALPRSRRGPRPGDRAPDAPVVDPATGRDTTLFEVLYGPGRPAPVVPTWTLLAFDDGGGPATPDPAGRLRPGTGPTDTGAQALALVRVAVAMPPVGGRGRVLLDLDRYAHRAYRIRGATLVLVRPDGHLAARVAADAAGTARLVEHLERLHVPVPAGAPAALVA